MRKRPKIPHKTEVKILMINKHQCCICRNLRSSSDIEIHHINGNPSDNRLENLAVLCSYHHKLAHGTLGNSKKLTTDEIKLNKDLWEKRVRKEIEIEKRNIPVKERKQLEILYKFEISKMKNEILSLSHSQERIRRNNYEFLQQLVVEEFITGIKLRPIILKAFGDIAVQSAADINISLPLIDAIRGLFLHLVGPRDVKMFSDDKKLLLKSLDELEIIGSYGAELSDDGKSRILKKTCDTIYELAEVCSWYKFSEFLIKAEKVLNRIKKDCSKYEPVKKDKRKQEMLIQKRVKIVDNVIQSIKNLR